eukprot:40101_1
MRYSGTLNAIKTNQRSQYFETLSNKIGMIITNQWHIDSGKLNDDIKYLHQTYGQSYSMDGFIVLLKAYLDKIPKKLKKKFIATNRETLLLDESKWICKICNKIVEDERNDNQVQIPHPACEICFDWYHVMCIKLACEDLASKKNIFLCREHSGNGQFIVRPKKGFKYM